VASRGTRSLQKEKSKTSQFLSVRDVKIGTNSNWFLMEAATGSKCSTFERRRRRWRRLDRIGGGAGGPDPRLGVVGSRRKKWDPRFGGGDGGPPETEVEMGNLEEYAK
jgi:hypothetical protein